MHSTITIGTFLRNISFYFTNHIDFLLKQNYFKFNEIIFQFFFVFYLGRARAVPISPVDRQDAGQDLCASFVCSTERPMMDQNTVRTMFGHWDCGSDDATIVSILCQYVGLLLFLKFHTVGKQTLEKNCNQSRIKINVF